MENAVEALKMAFGVLMFLLALSISMSSFSQARNTIDAVITLRDRETSYVYVEHTEPNRIVGIETVIPTMYKAYNENFKIIFKKADGSDLNIYKNYDQNGVLKEVNYVDLEHEKNENPIERLNVMLGKRPTDATNKYYNQFLDANGFYERFKNSKFEERLGEYYQEDAEAGMVTEGIEINKVKKRVITYTLQ